MTSEKSIDKIIKTIGFLLILILIPLVILIFIYYTNDNFRETTNGHLRNTPGFIGEYFSKFPTEKEKDDKVQYIAKYYIKLDKAVAGDKLYIIKKNDEQLYLDIIKKMKLISLNKTESIIKYVRDIELRKDSIISIYDEIEKEKENKLNYLFNRFGKLSTDIAILEIKEDYLNNYNNLDELIAILKNIKKDKLIDILLYLDKKSQNDIFEKLKINDTSFYKEIKSLLIEKEKKNEELDYLANVYEVMDVKKASDEIGNENKYRIEELSKIYLGLTPSKSAKILINSSIEFKNKLFESIRNIERLKNITNSITVEIENELTKIKQYNSNKMELVTLYEKMNPNEAAKLLGKMYVTDSPLVIDILLSMNKTKAASIINNLDTRTAVSISKEIFN